MRYYDPHNNRLVYIESLASENYWDDHWRGIDASKLYKPSVSPFNFVVNTTRKYLCQDSILKGLKDEIKTGRGWLQNLYSGRRLKDRIAIRLFDLLLSYWSSHMALLVFKKTTG